MRKDTADPNFIEDNLPRHGPMEALRDLIAAKPEEKAEAVLKYVGQFTHTADTTKTRPTNLLDLYLMDVRTIYVDAQERPDHYDARQHEILNHLVMHVPLSRPITDEEKNDLLLTHLRASVSSKKKEDEKKKYDAAQRKKREQEENDEITLEDGRSLSEAIEADKYKADPTFEAQDFGDKVII